MIARNAPGWFGPLCYEVRCELMKAGRNMAFLLPTVLTPLAFYALFALGMGIAKGIQAVAMLVTYCIFCAMAPGLFGVGTSVALERAMGWGALRRVSPLRPAAFVAAKLSVALMYCALSAGLLTAFAVLMAGVRMAPVAWLMLAAVVVLAGLFFAALGMLLGLVAEQGQLAVLGNLLFLPMAFLGGLWFPIQTLHPILQQIGSVLPTYHLGQLALMAAGLVVPEQLGAHIGAVIFWTVVMLVLAWRALRNRTWYRIGGPA